MMATTKWYQMMSVIRNVHPSINKSILSIVSQKVVKYKFGELSTHPSEL